MVKQNTFAAWMARKSRKEAKFKASREYKPIQIEYNVVPSRFGDGFHIVDQFNKIRSSGFDTREEAQAWINEKHGKA